MKRTPKFGPRYGMKRFVDGGATVKPEKKSSSKRADGIAKKGKTRGRFV